MKPIYTVVGSAGSAIGSAGQALVFPVPGYEVSILTSVNGTVTASTMHAPYGTIVTASTGSREDFKNVTGWRGTGCDFTGNTFMLTGDCQIEGIWGDNAYTASGHIKAMPGEYATRQIPDLSTYCVMDDIGLLYGNETIPTADYITTGTMTYREYQHEESGTVTAVDKFEDPYGKTTYSGRYIGVSFTGRTSDSLTYTAGNLTGKSTAVSTSTYTNNVFEPTANSSLGYKFRAFRNLAIDERNSTWYCSGVMR